VGLKVATWNVNSVRVREERLLRFLEREAPDALCLQEIKAMEETFPFDAVREAGYEAAVYGQKTYNGVAILSREPAQDVTRGLGDEDPQARVIAGTIRGIRVISAYFPNGKTVGSEHYAYKLQWMEKLRGYLEAASSPTKPLVLAGDFNVAPRDSDVASPDSWADSVLCHADVRAALQKMADWGLVDVFARHHPEGGVYSWWDYRMLAFPRNEGLRIDHIFATDVLAKHCTGARVDRDERRAKKTETKASDHAPVLAEFDID